MSKQVVSQVSRYDVWNKILDESGKPRLAEARREFLPLNQDKIPLLLEAFEYWKEFDEWLIIKDEDLKRGKNSYFGVKASKRGNDVFARRLKDKLRFLKDAEDREFFDPSEFSEDDLEDIAKAHIPKKKVSPGLLWITLTYDSKRCSLNDAWENLMDEFNLWITNLRNNYGRIWYVAFPQPFPGSDGEAYGYPHMHVLMIFEDAEFTVFPRLEKNRDGELQLVYRVEEKPEIHSQGRWHSFIDVKALSSGKHAYNYVLGYAERVCYGDSDKAIINNAIMWLYRKKTFNMSGRFREVYSEFISTLRSSKMVQHDLGGDPVPEHRFSLVGVYSGDEVAEVLGCNGGPPWFFSLDWEDIKEMDQARIRAY